MEDIWPVVWAVTPTVVLAVLFTVVMRGILRADRGEREAYDKVRREELARHEESVRSENSK